MKKIILSLAFGILAFAVNAQTSKELIGKWQLVKLTKKGEDKDIKKQFKTDQVYQIFQEDGKFEGIVGSKSAKGKWKLSKDNDVLTLTVDLIPTKFQIDYFDSEKRIISNSQIGNEEYKKLAN